MYMYMYMLDTYVYVSNRNSVKSLVFLSGKETETTGLNWSLGKGKLKFLLKRIC